jgi:hypothetical protein
MKKTLLLILTLTIQFVFAQQEQEIELKVENFPTPIFTNNNLSLLILGSAWNIPPVKGDELAVINFDGAIVGTSVVLLGHNGLAVWGDAPNTEVKDGLKFGERFGIIHWTKQNDSYYLYNNFKTQTGPVTYLKDGFTIVESLGETEIYTRKTDVYYHLKSVLSETNKFSFYTQQKAEYSLKISSKNTVLFELENLFYEKGFHSFDFLDTIPKGTYTVDLISNSISVSTKIFNVD